MGEICSRRKKPIIDEELERRRFEVWLDRKKARTAPRLRLEKNFLRRKRLMTVNVDRKSTAASDDEY